MRPGLRWYAAGDVNAFFGLALDNLTQLVILSSLLIGLFKFPADLVLFRMIPGTALGVLVGDLAYTWLAWRLARRTGREDVTAMPFGIDTPSLFGVVFGVLGPVMLLTKDPQLAWPEDLRRSAGRARVARRPPGRSGGKAAPAVGAPGGVCGGGDRRGDFLGAGRPRACGTRPARRGNPHARPDTAVPHPRMAGRARGHAAVPGGGAPVRPGHDRRGNR